MTSRHPDLVIVGAGIIGAACAYFASAQGLRVTVVDRSGVAAGTSSHGEGNVLVSDKEPGAELDLALLSNALWHGELAEYGPLWEYHAKGGVVVAPPEAVNALRNLTDQQRGNGIRVTDLGADELADYEPHLANDLAAGAYYPDDAQVQPMLAAAQLLRLSRDRGAEVVTGAEVTGLLRSRDRIVGIRTRAGELPAGNVLNATGPWAATLAAYANVSLPVRPRRGFVLVTEPLPVTIRHKVYAADYVSNVGSSDAGLQTSPVIEGTDSGTVLIGSSRERVGFSDTVSLPALRTMAGKAIALFPMLAGRRVLRHYHGFRPYCPDHLPVIGPDPRAPGLWHACGHEGAGIGLAAGTGQLIAQAITGQPTSLPLEPYAPERFDAQEAA